MRNFSFRHWASILFLLVCAVIVKELWALSGGAPPGFTGSYGDGNSTCQVCHSGPAPTPVSGWITSNIPGAGYVSGNTYTITAQATGLGHSKFGFEISPMDSSGNLIGTLVTTSTETALTGSGTYITHTSSGNAGVDGKTWNFDWIAPGPGTGNVTFYGAFNVTDNSYTDTDDTIYTSSYTVQEFSSTLVAEMAYLNGVRLFPNPVKDHIQLHFMDRTPALLSLSLYTLSGQSILNADLEQSGNGYVTYRLPDHIAPGVYMLNLNTRGKDHSFKLIVMN